MIPALRTRPSLISPLQLSNPTVKELLLQHLSIHPSPAKPTSNVAPVNSPTTVASPAPMRFSPTFLPGSGGSGSGAFSVPGRQKDRPSPVEGASYLRHDVAMSSLQPGSANAGQHRLVASDTSSLSSSLKDAEAKIHSLQTKLNEECSARHASEAAAEDLHRQLKARDEVVEELHKQLQQLEQQLFSVMSTLERSADDALHVERTIRSKSGPSSDDKRRMLPQQQQQQQQQQQHQQSQPRQQPSPTRHASSNGSAFAPSSGVGGNSSSSLRSPGVLSNLPAQTSAFDGQSTMFIKVSTLLTPATCFHPLD